MHGVAPTLGVPAWPVLYLNPGLYHVQLLRPSRAGDMGGLPCLYRPQDAEAGADGRHRQLADGVARQLQQALAADGGLSILRERREAVELLKDGQVTLRIGDGLEATEVLVMLVKAANDAFDGVVGRRDQAGTDAVGQPGPMALQEVKDDDSLGPGLDVGPRRRCNVPWPGLRFRHQKCDRSAA
jgi:hypothetical protein